MRTPLLSLAFPHSLTYNCNVALSPSDRAELLAKTTLFATAHSEAATSTQSSSAVPAHLDTDLHFTCFVQALDPKSEGGLRLVELDGRRVGPLDCGPSKKLLEDVAKVVKARYLKLSTSMQFGLVALCDGE